MSRITHVTRRLSVGPHGGESNRDSFWPAVSAHGGLEAFYSYASPVDESALAPDRGGDAWIARRVASNGIIAVSWQQISVGKHRAGAQVDVHVTDQPLQIWHGHELLKTVRRDNRGEVRKKRASVSKTAP